MRSTLHSISLLALATLTTAWSASAQCFESSIGTSLGTGDDTVFGIQSLGFAFPFNGTTYNDIHVTTNGLVYLSNAGTPTPGGSGCCSGTTATLVAGSPKIAPYWSDLNVVAGTGQVRYGTLPGKAVVTWVNAIEFGDATATTFTVQLQLLVTGEIYFFYSGSTLPRTAGDFLVGMSPGNAAPVPPTSDFSATNTSTTSTNFELFNNTVLPFDLAGQTLQFVPVATGYLWFTQPCSPPPIVFASNTSYGTGCYNILNDSFYQLTTAPATSAATLSNTAITLTPTGTGGYVVTNGGTYVAPTAAATPLTLTDDSATLTPSLSTPFPYLGGTASTLSVCSNGHVAVASGNSNAYAPTVATMLNSPQTAFWSWHDYNPAATGSGAVKFEEVAGVAYVTWDGVYNYSGTTAAAANTFQFQFNLTTGVVTIAYQTMSSATHTLPLGEPHLVGYSPGNTASVDNGSITFATALPIVVTAPTVALALTATPAPVSSSSSGTLVTYTTSNLRELAPGSGVYVGINILSLGQVPAPGIDLAILGAPGCAAFVQSIDFSQTMVGATSTQSVSLSLPAGLPGGLAIYSQSAGLTQPGTGPGQNAFGLVTSNGIASIIGL